MHKLLNEVVRVKMKPVHAEDPSPKLSQMKKAKPKEESKSGLKEAHDEKQS